MKVYIEMLTEVLVVKLVEEIMAGYTVMLVVKLEMVTLKKMNQKWEMKFVLGDDRIINKCVNGVNVGVSVGVGESLILDILMSSLMV